MKTDRSLGPPVLILLSTVAFCMLGGSGPVSAQLNIDIEKAPFEYSETAADNRVSRLIEQLNDKTLTLEYSTEQGYLRSLLQALEIPESSQMLVFSKTSMQVRYISRRNPRAIYFNDDTYVGWVRGSSLVEISTADPKLGAAFYTVDMMPWRAKVEQAYYDCLACHATSMTQGIPGHTVRSVFPEVDGSINAQKESFVTDHTSPFSERWGGWYVTGRHGDMHHMGNAFLRGGRLETQDNGNRLSLWDDFDTQSYLSPYSDITALMVLEHQTQMHNAMTRGDFSVRKILHDRNERNSIPGQGREGAGGESEAEWQAQLHLIAKEVVDRMLFCDEAPLKSAVNGSVIFMHDFTERGPKDSQGRSLRDFEMKTRMFKYPCSYLIYSSAFDSLEKPLQAEIIRQLGAILTGENPSEDYAHLDAQTRADILAILRETKPAFAL
jgi:hypothetical protein